MLEVYFLARRGGAFHWVLSDLARLGYDTEYSILGANQVGAPHERERIFIVGKMANTPVQGLAKWLGFRGDLNEERKTIERSCVGLVTEFPPGPGIEDKRFPEPAICRGFDGPTDKLDLSYQERIRLLGNGVVPLQAAYAFQELFIRFF